jgi:putative membrane protein insertion efficiency factor
MSYPARILVRLIALYKRGLSPLLGSRCRFYPTCSTYAAEAIERHGAVRGVYLGVRRLLRCHPFHPGGFDEVPGEFSLRAVPVRAEPAGDRSAA